MPSSKKNNARTSNRLDVPADDPKGTMERFSAGLRRVLDVSPKLKRNQQGKRSQQAAKASTVIALIGSLW